VLRSFPCALLTARNAPVISTQTVWLPVSSGRWRSIRHGRTR
jgi:hypothetical protein